MDKIIRNATEKDIDIVVKMYLDEVENHQQRAQQFAKDLIYRFKTIICVCDKNILGSITWDTRGGLDDGIIELVGLGTSSNFKRQGIARELVLSLINEVKKYFSKAGYKLRVIYLFMEKSNNIGELFYNHMGFRKVSDIPSLYPHDDAVIWVKYL
jgi:ribosomal protein S18 acetylase RimI-like enzyme